MTTHTITLARHTAQVVGLMGVLVLGTWDSYGTEQLLLRHGPEWDGLAIDATFHNVPNDEGVTVLADTDGLVPVPPEACMRASKYATITIRGVQDGVQRISCNLPYMVLDHAQVPGANSTATPSENAQALAQMQDLRDGAVDAKNQAEAARDDAARSAVAAKESETNAGQSATAAKTAQSAAETAKSGAETAQKAAASSASSASTSASTATTQAAAAKSSATTAKTSETAASVSAEAAKASESAAASSEAAARKYANSAELAAKTAGKAAAEKLQQMQAIQDDVTAKQAQTATDATAAEKAKVAAEAAQKGAAASETDSADSAAAAKTSEDAAAKSAEDADNTANSIKDSMAQISENKEAVSKLKEDLGDCIRIANYTRLTPVFDKKGLYWSCNPDYKLCVLYANEYKEAKVYEVHKGKRYTVCGMSDGNNTSPLVIFSKTYPTVKGETSSYENFIAGSNSGHTVTTEKHISSPIDGYMLITSSTVYGGYAIEEGVRLIVDDRYGLYVSDGCYTTFSKIGNNTYLCRIFKNVYINQLFDFNGCYIGKFDEYGELYKYKDFGTFPSDVVGPIAIRENDWSATTKFSGGSHGIEISGTNYPTAKQKTLLVKCGNKTIDTDGYYIGQTEFVSKNILYIPMTITGNDLSSAKEGIEETRRYCINDVLSVSVDYNMLTDIIADVLYGFQLQIYGMEEITLPNNEVKVSVNQEQNYVFKKPENKYICTNENGDYCSVEMSTCGLGDFLKNNGESVTKYGYISVFKNPNKIYFQLINHGVQLATGKTLHWDAICNHRPH